MQAQKIDPTLMPMFEPNVELADGYRVAPDGVLERPVFSVQGIIWVPIAPAGYTSATFTWRQFVFLRCHVGLLGSRRNAIKTALTISRLAWRPNLRADVEAGVYKCIACLRFRRVAQKQEAQPVIPASAECWEEVMIDLEGPSHPPDKDGNKRTVTCCLRHGILMSRAPVCNAVEASRMFADCVSRSGAIPTWLCSNRGPELKNALAQEYTFFSA
jgi:hypothetical protein